MNEEQTEQKQISVDAAELDQLMTENAKYKFALQQIETAPLKFKRRPFNTKADGVYEGLAAAGRVARQALKGEQNE